VELTASNVQAILVDCLFKDDEIVDGKPAEGIEFVMAHGVMRQFGFHKARLESHREDITEMLRQLEPEFRENSGGGMSFLRMCMTSQGVIWGEHSNCDELVCLGIAIDKCAVILREIMADLPGGVPYIIVKGE
jgi:hypothetical protein